ncbi:hypothetical protein ONO23_06272 [Micromonospora noduli]|nr:hypothetical protein ONO23_06272 [Micromonospora noduli]
MHGEGRVPDPGVAVVPVPLPADLLGQPRGGRGDQGAGRCVRHQLEGHRRPLDHLAPAALVPGTAHPPPPVVAGLGEQIARLVGAECSRRVRTGSLQDHPADVAGMQRERRGHTVGVPFDVPRVELAERVLEGGQGEGHRRAPENVALGVHLQLVRIAPVVEPGVAVEAELHAPPDHPDQPDQPVPVGGLRTGDRHEVQQLTDTVGAVEARDQDRRTGQVELFARVVDAVGRELEVAAVAAVEQRAEDARRVEAGRAEPVDRTVRADQCRGL